MFSLILLSREKHSTIVADIFNYYYASSSQFYHFSYIFRVQSRFSFSSHSSFGMLLFMAMPGLLNIFFLYEDHQRSASALTVCLHYLLKCILITRKCPFLSLQYFTTNTFLLPFLFVCIYVALSLSSSPLPSLQLLLY